MCIAPNKFKTPTIIILVIIGLTTSCMKNDTEKQKSSIKVENINHKETSVSIKADTISCDKIDSIVFKYYGPIAPESNDSLIVSFKGNDLNANLIYNIYLHDTLVTIEVTACKFPVFFSAAPRRKDGSEPLPFLHRLVFW